MNNCRFFLFFICLMMGFPSTVLASVKISGTFTAKHACQAYVSKNKKTNPNHQLLEIGQTYSVIEANRPDNPNWFRIEIEGTYSTERWVHKKCGALELSDNLSSPSPKSNYNRSEPCHTPGNQTSYVLAISWQPAFCEAHQNQPECRITNTKAYQATHFTLHGLWPNWKSHCKLHYQFCDYRVTRKPRNKCQYPQIEIFDSTRKHLRVVMPSVIAGSCLQRHQWWKHGTCSGWNADTYFKIAIRLVEEFNDAGMATFLATNVGKNVQKRTFLNKIDQNFGAKAHQLIKLSCRKSNGNVNLTEVQITLPRKIGQDDSLASLIKAQLRQGKLTSNRGNCPSRFRIDPIDD